MSNVFYTSDLHISHRLVSGIRGFWNEDDVREVNGVPECAPDPEEHDLVVAANWDAVVKPGDTVYVLGDISINGGQHALDWIAKRPGTKHLIAGNHDPVHPGIFHARALRLLPHWLQYFETIQPFVRRKLFGESVLLSHFPYAEWGDGPERDGSRFNEYRLPDTGLRLLHGHTHGKEVVHGRSFHVGLDAHNLQLVPQDEILSWIENTKEQVA